MRLAFVTLLSDDYCLGGALSIYTLLRSTPNFTHPIIVLEWGQLSSNSKNKLKALYSNITFKRIVTSDYPKPDFDKTHRRWRYNCGYRFDIFTLTQFDKILFFDSDILFQQNMNSVINREIDFGVIERPIERGIQFNGKKYFNGGLLLIGKKFLNKKVKDDLLYLLQQAAPKDSRDILITSNKWVGNEPILNTYFEPYATFIEKKYNFCIDEYKADILKHQYNLHFIGENKPWNANKFDAHITNMLVEQNTQVQATQLQQHLFKFVHTNLNLLYRDFPMFLTRQTLHTAAKFNLFLRDLDVKP
jgi:lipopolysaccharide biosynthesis glycosyltransferase